MLNLKDFLIKKELIFYYLFYLSFLILAYIPRFMEKYHPLKLNNSSKAIIAFTTEDYLDKTFTNLIPYLEPNAMDHFSYAPRRIKSINYLVNRYYGYDLLEKNKEVKECNNYYRSSLLNVCLTNQFWKILTKDEWLLISNETNVNYVVSRLQLNNLHLCQTFINKYNKSKFYYYYIPSKLNPNKYCYKLNER